MIGKDNGCAFVSVVEYLGTHAVQAQADGSADTSFVVTGDGKPVDTNKQNSEADNTSALSSCDNTSDSSNVLVNINTAGVDELCTLSGIGKSRADAIIAYRNENGPFKSIEDIKKVSGIKDKVFEQIKDSITVEKVGTICHVKHLLLMMKSQL